MKDVATPIGEKGSVKIAAWFRQEWFYASDDVCEMQLTVGAGCGSKWGTFRYTRVSDGAQVRLAFDGTELAAALEALALERLAARDRPGREQRHDWRTGRSSRLCGG